MKIRFFAACAGLAFLFASAHAASAGTTTVIWHGHAAFEIRTPAGKVLMIDPWLKNPVNPAAKNDKNPVQGIHKVDYILLTHGHFDHAGDAAELAQKTGARLVATFELGTNMAKLLGYPENQMGFDTLMNIGGEISIADGEVTVTMTPAIHSSGVRNPKAGENDAGLVYGGNPVGFVLKIRDGLTLYHTGDTAYFSDMKLIGEVYHPDLALINIGGHFGMEPPMAAKAAEAVKAHYVIPHHYGTFPVLTPDPGSFSELLARSGMKVVAMRPGSSVTFVGNKLKE